MVTLAVHSSKRRGVRNWIRKWVDAARRREGKGGGAVDANRRSDCDTHTRHNLLLIHRLHIHIALHKERMH